VAPCILGWSIYGLLTIGHDAYHGSFSPYPIVNKLVGFLCMDMVMMAGYRWKREHNTHHHRFLYSDSDTMRLIGPTVVQQWLRLVRTNCKGVSFTFADFVIRVPFLYVLWYHLCILQILLLYMSMMICQAYLAYITHMSPVMGSCSVQGTVPHTLDHTWDIFPDSKIASFFSGGMNSHASHHCFPSYTRTELRLRGPLLLRTTFPTQYRVIRSWFDYVKLGLGYRVECNATPS
jgi:fatty acid desaturase